MSKCNHIPTKPCHACNGSGYKTLSEAQMAVLKAFQSRRKPATVEQVFNAILKRNGTSKIKGLTELSSAHQKARALESYGMIRKVVQVDRDSSGKRCRRPAWEYEAVNHKSQKRLEINETKV